MDRISGDDAGFVGGELILGVRCRRVNRIGVAVQLGMRIARKASGTGYSEKELYMARDVLYLYIKRKGMYI